MSDLQGCVEWSRSVCIMEGVTPQMVTGNISYTLTCILDRTKKRSLDNTKHNNKSLTTFAKDMQCRLASNYYALFNQ